MMLMREVRCFPKGDAGLSPPGKGRQSVSANSWAGTPAHPGLDTFWILRAIVEGPVDPQTGYLCDIKRLDALLLGVVAASLGDHAAGQRPGRGSLALSLTRVFPAAARGCPAPALLRSLQLAVSPYLIFTVVHGDPTMVRLTQSFEFSAAHRLSAPGFTDEENLRVFGKCSNPHGHGHNYVLEVTVAEEPDETGVSRESSGIDLPRLNRVVHERVIDAFDHKNLNLECAEFASMNPSVENIARVIWQRLAGSLLPARLAGIRVWETPKTYAECTQDSP